MIEQRQGIRIERSRHSIQDRITDPGHNEFLKKRRFARVEFLAVDHVNPRVQFMAWERAPEWIELTQFDSIEKGKWGCV